MKKSITIFGLLAGAMGVYAQGSVELGDYIPVSFYFGITIWSPQNDVTQQLMGQNVLDLVPGTIGIGGGPTTYQGQPLGGASTGSGPTAYGNGNLWTLAIYAAPGVGNAAGIAKAEANNSPVFTSLFFTSGGTGTANAGVNNSDTAGAWSLNFGSTQRTTLTGFPGGGTFQLAVWYSGSGLTLTEAEAATYIPYGFSTEGSIAELGNNGNPPTPSESLGAASPAITSFSLIETVPEPSAIALGVMGASALLVRRGK